MGYTVPVRITVFEDRSYTFVVKQPLTSDLIKNALKLPKGSGKAGTESAGVLTMAQAKEIAKMKMADLNANDEEAALKIVAGTARSMGIQTDF
jgi:large subunit ribosomal protein L11